METSVIVMAITHFIPAPYLAIIALIGWGLSEALSMIPSIKANGVFQLVYNIFQKLFQKEVGQTAAPVPDNPPTQKSPERPGDLPPIS